MHCTLAMLFLSAGLLAGAPSCAQEGPAPAGPLPWRAAGWIGLGREAMPQAGHAVCTGVLVEPDLAVTAGHCVAGLGASAAAEVTFRLGQSREGSLAVRHGLAISRVPAEPGSAAAQIGQDRARVRLDAPVPDGLVSPLSPAAAPPVADSTVAILGYRRDAPDAPEVKTTCRVRVVDGALFGLDCPAVSGYSGGPVLTETAEGWRLAGVMVAQARGVPGLGALALWLDPAQSAAAPD
jgi:V8-like Glu-specific endopeptidase